MNFTKLPIVFTDKLIQCFNGVTIKILRETTVFFKQMVDERASKTSLVRNSKAVYNFEEYTTDTFEMFCDYTSRSQIKMIEFKQFRYCNDHQMVKIKTTINNNVDKLILNNLNTDFSHVRVFLQSLQVEEVQFKNCKTKLTTSESADQLSNIYKLMHELVVEFNASGLSFIGCSMRFINDFLRSYVVLPNTRRISIQLSENEQACKYYGLTCSCLSMKMVDKQMINKSIEYECELN
jgi:hypothetical protein